MWCGGNCFFCWLVMNFLCYFCVDKIYRRFIWWGRMVVFFFRLILSWYMLMSEFILEMFVFFLDFVKFFFKSLINFFKVVNMKFMIVLNFYIIVMDGGRRWRNGRSVMRINSLWIMIIGDMLSRSRWWRRVLWDFIFFF